MTCATPEQLIIVAAIGLIVGAVLGFAIGYLNER
jgi:membrane protein DedA with SNARE-associated domain